MAGTTKASTDKTFVFKGAANAKSVHVAGDFNNWSTTATAMARSKNGTFRTKVRLSPGEHQYKFLVDGQWVADNSAERQIANRFGTSNSVVRVP
jgi:1,4-alpha-glucan branching enzyme